jgi:sporulation protein YlmC with PRC-barrel domain
VTTKKEAAMRFQHDITPKTGMKTIALPYVRYGGLLTFFMIGAMLGLLLIATGPRSAHSQGVQLVKVDVAVVASGYRVSKLTGHSVVNEKNENIGKIDDVVIARGKSLFTVLQVGGFLGIASRFVAVPFDSLKIDENGNKIELPGASRDELKKLADFNYGG